MARGSRASKVQSEQHTTEHDHSADEVANAFVEQYYKILSHFPELSYKFYREESIVSFPGADGVRSVTTIKGIDEEIMGSAIKNSSIDLLTVHAHDTVAESVIVVVVGLLRKDNMSKRFSQTFLLAPQARGFYVHNDFFQFIDATYQITPEDTGLQFKDKGTSIEGYVHGINQLRAYSSDTKNSELPNEPNKINSPQIAQSFSESQDDVKILSYASIVAKANLLPTPNATVGVSPKIDLQSSASPNKGKDTTIEAPCEDLENNRNHEFSSTNDVTDHIKNGQIEKTSPPNGEQIEKNDSYASIIAKELSLTIPEQASAEVLADRNSTNVSLKPSVALQIDKTIYVRDLPPQVTRRTLTHAVKRFGSVKHRNIQIRGYLDGYRYAFVEFNHLKAARLAVEAGFIKFDDWECEVESKKAHLEGL